MLIQMQMVVIRPFLFDGKDLREGDRVDMTGQKAHFVRKLIDQRRIREATPEDLKAAPQAPKPKEVKQTPAETPKVGTKGFVASHKGFGRWFVLDAAGAEIAGPMKQAEAMAEADKLNGGA